jgi:hypothetical protein
MARYSDDPLNVKWDRLSRDRSGRRRRPGSWLLGLLLVGVFSAALASIAMTLPLATEHREAAKWLDRVANPGNAPTIRESPATQEVTDADPAYETHFAEPIAQLDGRSIVMFEITPLTARSLMVALVVVFLLWCLIRPNVGRLFARIVAVFGIGTGVGVLTWGICAVALGDTMRTPVGFEGFIAEPSEAIGWGAGLLAGGIAAMVVSFVGNRKERDGKKRC